MKLLKRFSYSNDALHCGVVPRYRTATGLLGLCAVAGAHLDAHFAVHAGRANIFFFPLSAFRSTFVLLHLPKPWPILMSQTEPH